jgi:hypothetical protein
MFQSGILKECLIRGEASAENFDYLTNSKWNEIVDYVKQFDDKNLVNIHKMYDFDILHHISDEKIEVMQSRVVKTVVVVHQKYTFIQI